MGWIALASNSFSGHQTVVQLGTYTAKVPMYNSLKACKGVMFFLPLPLEKTLDIFDEVDNNVSLASPELYIIVNGKPTKTKVVWHSLVDVNEIKKAVQKLKDINWLYKDFREDSVDEAVQDVVEVVKKTSSTVLEKVTKEDIFNLQCYTIRNLSTKQFIGDDIEQYKLMNVQEEPIDSQVSLAEQRLLFQEKPSLAFYLLWYKELREVSAGMYNLLKSHKARPMSASSLINRRQLNDELLETNLSTMLQTVRGTTQFWFKKQSKLRCMVCDFDTPTLFLTFSCAEYGCHDIADYLKTVNNVPEGYDVGKLCTEDPISVSRQFSLKFHAFFNKIIIKGKVLGTVDHYMWKKEYQNRGAPHYHVLLWIRDAPVIGVDDADKVLAWIEDRITCKLPDKESDPELHALVTKYQLHKCSGYYKRKIKRGRDFVTPASPTFLEPHKKRLCCTASRKN